MIRPLRLYRPLMGSPEAATDTNSNSASDTNPAAHAAEQPLDGDHVPDPAPIDAPQEAEPGNPTEAQPPTAHQEPTTPGTPRDPATPETHEPTPNSPKPPLRSGPTPHRKNRLPRSSRYLG